MCVWHTGSLCVCVGPCVCVTVHVQSHTCTLLQSSRILLISLLLHLGIIYFFVCYSKCVGVYCQPLPAPCTCGCLCALVVFGPATPIGNVLWSSDPPPLLEMCCGLRTRHSYWKCAVVFGPATPIGNVLWSSDLPLLLEMCCGLRTCHSYWKCAVVFGPATPIVRCGLRTRHSYCKCAVVFWPATLVVTGTQHTQCGMLYTFNPFLFLHIHHNGVCYRLPGPALVTHSEGGVCWNCFWGGKSAPSSWATLGFFRMQNALAYTRTLPFLLRWCLTVYLINYSQNVYKHCARKEHAITLWRPVMETPNTVLFSECYMQCQTRRNSTTASKTEGALNSKRCTKSRTRCNSVTMELIIYRWVSILSSARYY